MLKGRGKVFAPKKVVRKPQGSAPSSTRPSVERSSQTPAPQPSQETSTLLEKVVASDSTNESSLSHVEQGRRQIPSQEDQSQAAASVTQDVGNSSRLELKRKDRGDGIAPPPPKRVSTAIEKSFESTPITEHAIIDISSQENTPQPEPDSVPVVSTAQPPSISKSTSQIQPASQSTARPRIIPPKQKQKEVVLPIPRPTPGASPEFPRQDGPGAAPPPAQSTSLEPTGTATENRVLNQISTAPETVSSTDEPPPDTVRGEAGTQAVEEEHAANSSPEGSPEPPRHRYPSPQNLVRIVDENPGVPSTMGRAGGGGIGIGSGDISLRPGEVNQASEIVPIGVLNPDGTSGAIQVEEPPSATESAAEKDKAKPKRKYTKRKKVQPPGDGEDARTTLGMHLNRPRRVAGGKGKGTKKDGTRGRKERAQTPDGASDEEIDQSTLTMTDLCKDLRIGKKFSRHKEIKDRVKANKRLNMKKKMIMNNPEIDGLVGDGPPEGNATASGSTSGPGAAPPASPTDREATPEVAAGAGGGPQIRLVNGELVVDEASLQIDRQARARANAMDMEEVIEDDFTRVITSGTYMKREKSMLWDHAATIRFYEGLAQFGTDFEMIAKLFPHRNRRQIKLKFNKEERAHPDRVTKAMVGPKKRAIDLNTFERLADEKLEDVAAIEAEYEAYENRMLAKEKEEMDAAAEITRQKKAAIQGSASAAAARKLLATVDSDDEGGGDRDDRETRVDSAKENSQQRKRGQKKRNRHSHYAGGEKVTVLGTID